MATYKSQFTGPQIDEALGRATSGGAIDAEIGELAEQAQELQNELDIKADVWNEIYQTGLAWSHSNTATAINNYVTAAGGFDAMPTAKFITMRFTDNVHLMVVWMKINTVEAFILIPHKANLKSLAMYIYLNGGSALHREFINTAMINRETAVNTADTDYTKFMARGEALRSDNVNPTANGTIAWKYE